MSGCSAGTVSPPGYTGRTPPAPGGLEYRLERVGAGQINVSRRMSATLQVRYLDEIGAPARGRVIFTIEGEAAGASLQAEAVEVDHRGLAEVGLEAGPEDTEFDVVVSADYAQSIEFHVEVTINGAGDLLVHARPEGEQRLEGADVYLYEDRACDELEAEDPAPADRLQSTGSIREDAKFEALERDSQWTVFVLGLGESGHPVATGCIEEVVIEGGEEVEVEVPLYDLPTTFDGVFSIESHFMIADALPEDARHDLEVLQEIADDPNDPATYFLDLLGEQIDDDVIRWAYRGARVVTGFDARINNLIMDWTPDILWDLAEAGGDLAEILEDARIDSIMTIETTGDDPDAVHDDDDVDVDPAVEPGPVTRTATHELVDLVFELDGVVHRFSVDRDAGITDAEADDIAITLEEDEVHIAQHEFKMGLGTLTRFAMNEVVLPQLPGRPHSMAEFMAELLPCEWLGDELSYSVGVGGDSLWVGLCEMAGGMIGQALETRIMRMDDRWDTLQLEGTAQIGDDDKDMTIDFLDDGEWTANMTGPSGVMPIEATFEGEYAAPQRSR